MLVTMFKDAKPLNKEQDKEMKISPVMNFKFAKQTHFMPLSVDEIKEACKHYPILFLKETKEGKDVAALPVCLLGIKEKENLFVNKPGDWDSGRYIPLAIRAYPFSVMQTGEVFSLVFDYGYEGIDEKNGKRFIDDKGELNEFGGNIIDFVKKTYQGLDMAKNTAKIIMDEKLLKPVDIGLEKEGQKYRISGLFQVDIEALNALKDDKLLLIAKSGALNMIYGHLISLSNFDNVLKKIKK